MELYSGNLSWVKTLVNFMVLRQILKSFNHENFDWVCGIIINGRAIILDNGDSVGIMDVDSLSLARQYLSNSSFPNRHVDMVASINGRHFVAF